jgi:hypothetical protein
LKIQGGKFDVFGLKLRFSAEQQRRLFSKRRETNYAGGISNLNILRSRLHAATAPYWQASIKVTALHCTGHIYFTALHCTVLAIFFRTLQFLVWHSL